jgi:hypothetical protein
MTVHWLTLSSIVVCQHQLGVVDLIASQSVVRINGSLALVEPDPEGRAIGRCPNIGATIKPCQHTLAVTQGYSTFVRVGGRPVVLDSLRGLTDGTPPGVVEYLVADPRQTLVTAAA